MNKFLRYSLSLVLAFVASVTFAQEVTFDFDNDYKTLFPELTGTSSSDSKDGDITKAMTCTTNGISVTVSAKTSGSNENRIWIIEGTKRSVYLRESPKMMEEPRIEIVR